MHRPFGLVVAAACLVAWCPAHAGDSPAGEDPWHGKPRSEIVKLLGEPDKAKPVRGGGETLAYTLYRIAPDAPPHPQALLIEVPGVGVVARIDRSLGAERMTIEPPMYDEQGRPVGGGLTSTRGASTSYDLDEGKLSRSSTQDDKPLVAGKVKVRFVLDASGQVVDWSVSGKKK